MFKRMMLALTFAVALSAAGVGMADKATAYGGCGRGGYGGYGGHGGGHVSYYGYGNYYGGYPQVYPSYFASGYTYVPPVVYYPGGGRHHRHHHHHDHDRGGVSFSIGF